MKDVRLCRLLFLVTFLFGLGEGPAWALPADTWLVAIGNNRGDAGEEGLLYAERDAREFAATLHITAGLDTARTRLLLGTDAATVRRVLTEIEIRLRPTEGAPPPAPSALIIYYSGHADAQELHLEGTHLPFDELRQHLASSPAGLRLLIVDSCRSGGASRVKGVAPGPNFALSALDPVTVEGMAIMTSSAATESSQESEILKGSFFTHHLMSGLRGAADRNGDGRITLAETYSYTYEQTLRSTGRTLGLQHPTYSFDLKGRGDVVLSQPGQTDRVSTRLKLSEEGLYLLSEGTREGAIFAEVTAPRQGTTILLPPGRYFVQHRALREFREYAVLLPSGATVDMGTQPYRSVAYDRLVRRRGARLKSVHGIGVLGAVRGEILDGEGPTGSVLVRYGADLPWLSIEARLRATSVALPGIDFESPRRRSEVGLGLAIQRYVDLTYASVSFGIWIEGTLHVQSLAPPRMSADRRSLGMMFGGFLALERQLYRGLTLRLEGGPVTPLFLQSQVSYGAEIGQSIEARLTYWLAGGLLWRL